MNLNVKKEGNLVIVEVSVERRSSLRTQQKVTLSTEDIIGLLKEQKDLPHNILFITPGLQEIPLQKYCVTIRGDHVDNENPKALLGTWIFEVITPPPVVKKITKRNTSKPNTTTSVKKPVYASKTKTKEDK